MVQKWLTVNHLGWSDSQGIYYEMSDRITVQELNSLDLFLEVPANRSS